MHRIDGMACCGIYYIPVGTYEPLPLPLLSLTTEITLTPTYSRTVLKQHFKNPSPTDAISEANYVFPLHTTQTITSFTCHVGEDKTLNGIVQSKPKAKATYDAAVSRGETAGLLSWAASDVWQTKLGNVPAGASIEVIITCVAQLQHDSEKDAIRFNLPTYIASRYGAPPPEVYSGGVSYSYRLGNRGPGSWTILRGTNNWVDIDGGMNIKVFVEMDCPIKMVEAPAHATNLAMGTHSASDSSEDFDPKKALLTLSSEKTALDKDFVVLVKTARSGHPSAVVQRHPTKDTAALMLTLVPKFNLPVARPEVVFICDRSGSMSGNEVQLRKALAVFLQSLPVGCKFNICSFGSSHSFLWSKSKTYSEETLKEAQEHVSQIEADMGGTEMFPPVKAAIERRYKDLNLELLLLTDGDIWHRDQLMDYVREQCKAKTIRMFTLGIGNGISHALIDGLASVGGGYSQVVQLEEKLDSKVVRMLRAALGQHVSDYTLELAEPAAAAATPSDDDDEYDMLGDAQPEKIVISGKKEEEPKAEPKKISLFDTSAELDPPPEYESKDTDEARWAHLPPLPKLPAKIQSPHVIPPLFSFSRTNAYVVFSPCPKTFPKVAKLQAKTISGDVLELEIPILKVEDGKDVSQLAARSFLQELEDGKGYLHEGLLEAEGFTKEKQESKWDEIVEREGVRWGEGFGVASKWTSFVAIEDKAEKEVVEVEEAREADIVVEQAEVSGGGGSLLRRKASPQASGMASKLPAVRYKSPPVQATAVLNSAPQQKKRGLVSSFGISSMARSTKSADQSPVDLVPRSSGYAAAPSGFGFSPSVPASYQVAPAVTGMFGGSSGGFPVHSPLPPHPPGLAYGSSGIPSPSPVALQDYQMQLMLLEQQNKKRLMMARDETDTIILPGAPPPPQPQAGFAGYGRPPVSVFGAPPTLGGSEFRQPAFRAQQQQAQQQQQQQSYKPSYQRSPDADLDFLMTDSLTTSSYSGAPPPPRASFAGFASAPPPPPPPASVASFAGAPPPPPGFAGGPPPPPPIPSSAFAEAQTNHAPSSALMYDSRSKEKSKNQVKKKKGAKLFRKSSATPEMSKQSNLMDMDYNYEQEDDDDDDDDMGSGLFDSASYLDGSAATFARSRSITKDAPSVSLGTPEERIHGLIMIQSFAGSFAISDTLGKIIEASFKNASASDVLKKLKELAKTLGVKEEIVATWAAVLVFEKGDGHAAERDTWELVVDKAVTWVEGEGSGDDVKEKVREAIGA